MRDVDSLRIRNLLGNIAEAQGRLRELGELPEAEFLGDYRNTESAKYLLIVAAEAAIDVCNHIQNDLGDLDSFRQQVSGWLEVG